MLVKIDNHWNPDKRTTDALINKKGFSRGQIVDILDNFRARNNNLELDQAEATKRFNQMFDKLVGKNIKSKECHAIQEREEKRKHKSDKSKEKAEEVKKTSGAMTQAEAIQWYESRRG